MRLWPKVSEHFPAVTEGSHETSQFTQSLELNWKTRLPENEAGILSPYRKFEAFLSNITGYFQTPEFWRTWQIAIPPQQT
jgi:hypothetical protein